MKKRNILLTLLLLLFVLAVPSPVHAAASNSKTAIKAYQTFLKNKINKKKYFQVVPIGEKNAPVLLVGKGKAEADTDNKKYFYNCDVYCFYQGKVKKLTAFKDYGARWISLRKNNNNYYIGNGLSDGAIFYQVKNAKAKIIEYYNCHTGKKEENWMKSKITLNGKTIKNYGYLKAKQYEKKRDSYQYIKNSIEFQKNTNMNRKKIVTVQ